MSRYLLLRHGRPIVPPGTCYGRLDIDAEAVAPSEMVALSGCLRRATIWSSPSRRCVSLAILIASRQRRRPLVDHRLLELDFGAWEGCPWSAVPGVRLEGWAHAPLGRGAPGGESGAGLIARVRSFARQLRARPGRHIVVSHGGPLVILAALLDGRRPNLLADRPPFTTFLRPGPTGGGRPSRPPA